MLSEARNTEIFMQQLYSEHAPMLLSWSMRIVKDRQAAQDVVQETMVRAWRSSDRLSPVEGSVKGWLMRVAHNVAVDWVRARRARPVAGAEIDEDSSAIVDDAASGVASAVAVRQVLTQLSPLHRAVIFQVYYMDQTVPEAARRLGVPLGTVKSRLFYALRELRSTMSSCR